MSTRTSAVAAALSAMFLLGACGGSSSSEARPEPAAGGASDSRSTTTLDAPGQRAADSSGEAGEPGRLVTPMSRSVISTGEITLHARDMEGARADVLRLVSSWRGIVADERASNDDRGRLVQSTMTLRVPSERFDEAMAALAELGEVEQQSRSSQDVTTEVIDTDARVRAAERSIRQLVRLLDRAAKLSDIISIEAELARRQADLDSLKSQQAWLADQTSQSTITLHLSRPTDHGDDEARGFVAGLERGWQALVTATAVLLTVLGAALPFALVLAVVGVPLWLVWRRRRRRAVSQYVS